MASCTEFQTSMYGKVSEYCNYTPLMGNFGNFGIDNLESMGLPAHGDIITSVNGVPHIRTEFGNYHL